MTGNAVDFTPLVYGGLVAACGFLLGWRWRSRRLGTLLAIVGFAIGFLFAAILPGLWPEGTEEQVAPVATGREGLQGVAFLGAESCRECHQEKYEGFRHTAHHLTSQLPSEEGILGAFSADKNIFQTGNPKLSYLMEQRGDEFYQTGILQRGSTEERRTERIEMVIGSGKLGQSYLYWHQGLTADGRQFDLLFQLPISYVTGSGKWENSPGYVDGEPNFERGIFPRCLECHATWFDPIEPDQPTQNAFRKDAFLLGISCEKCHGAGRDHVDFHRRNPDEQVAQHIVNPGALGRLREIELCTFCHSSPGEPLQPSFTYAPGQLLADYVRLDPLEAQNRIGVHSDNQYARLSESPCFIGSEEMTCTTCHDPHALERGQLALFSQRCMKCHEPERCGMASKIGAAIRQNCIDCHLPKRKDEATPFETPEGTKFVELRDHFIGIYSDQTQEFMERLKNASQGSVDASAP